MVPLSRRIDSQLVFNLLHPILLLRLDTVWVILNEPTFRDERCTVLCLNRPLDLLIDI